MKNSTHPRESRSTASSPRHPLRRPRRKSSTPRIRARRVALGCFLAALLLMGFACCLALGWPPVADTPASSIVASTLAGTMALVGLGILHIVDAERTVQEPLTVPSIDPVENRLRALQLTAKELAVARLILQHCSYRDIARICGIAPRTVQFHASNAFRKADAARRRDFEQLMLEGPREGSADRGACSKDAVSDTKPTPR